MDPKATLRLSKFLSQHLRHQPQAIGLTLQPGGWVGVADLLAACAAHGHPLTRDELEDLVEDNDKQRFTFDEAGQRLRAQQGHSVEVDLQLVPAAPPALLYHGTAPAALPAIWAAGLQKMSRHHVHLAADEATAGAAPCCWPWRPPRCMRPAACFTARATACGWSTAYRRSTCGRCRAE